MAYHTNLVLMGKLGRSHEGRGVGFSCVIFQPDEKMVRRKEGGAGSVGSIQGL
jgi:hypothetical protein